MENRQSNQTPRISILIPAYNTASMIARCLDSVFAQTFRDFEAIVVNDGSPDTPELEKVLQPYLDRIVYIVQPNKRAAGARNTAIAHARGEFLAFLDSDDSWLPHHLESQMNQFEADPALGLVYANAVLIGDPARQMEFMAKCPSEGDASFEALVVERCQVPVSTVVARKAAVVKAGGFDEGLARCDDYDMWLRTAFHSGKVGYSRQVQARLADGRPGSLGQSRAKMAEAYWLILGKADRTLPLNPAQRHLVRERAAEIRARFLLEEGKDHLCSRNFAKARERFAEANHHFKKAKLSLMLLGLKLAPNATSKLFAYWTRRHHGAPA
ncbi:MAG TPA: glycosyltransferase family A protein [Terriglobales bacterium]|nr:glycosyltransferase family A protein [Terriglobales bacterium]